MSHWQEYNIDEKIINILRAHESQGHHFGRPFLTAYQLAIEFALRHPDIVSCLGKPVGGADVGRRDSLAQYLALELSNKIKAGDIAQIEGRFLSNQHINDISFKKDRETIHSSISGSRLALSMFRLCDE